MTKAWLLAALTLSACYEPAPVVLHPAPTPRVIYRTIVRYPDHRRTALKTLERIERELKSLRAPMQVPGSPY